MGCRWYLLSIICINCELTFTYRPTQVSFDVGALLQWGRRDAVRHKVYVYNTYHTSHKSNFRFVVDSSDVRLLFNLCHLSLTPPADRQIQFRQVWIASAFVTTKSVWSTPASCKCFYPPLFSPSQLRSHSLVIRTTLTATPLSKNSSRRCTSSYMSSSQQVLTLCTANWTGSKTGSSRYVNKTSHSSSYLTSNHRISATL